MANEDLGSMIVRVGLDGTDFDKGAKNLNAKMKLAQSELKASASSFENFGKSVDGLKAKQDGLSKIYDLQGQKVKELKQRYDELVKTQGANSAAALKAGRSLNSSISYYNKLGNQVDTVKGELNDLTNELNYQASGWEKAEKAIGSFADKANNAGQSMQSIGQTLTLGISAPLAALGGLALKAADDFQKSQGNIQSELGISEDKAKELNKTAQDLWKEGFGESIQDVSTKIAGVTKSLGDLSKVDLSYVTAGLEVFESKGWGDQQETLRAVRVLMESYGMSAKEAMDYLTRGFQENLNYSGEFLDTVSEYSTYFSELGFTSDEMFAKFKSGAESGAFQLDKVGDSMKEFSLRSKDGSKTSTEAFQALGLNANEMTKQFNQGGDTAKKAFEKVVSALQNTEDETIRNTASTGLFGTQYEDLGEKAFDAMLEASKGLENVEGATKKASDAIKDNLGQRMQNEMRELGAALQPLGDVLLDVVEPALNSASEHIKTFTEWMEGLSPAGQKAVVAILGIAAVIPPLLVGFGFVAQGVGAVSTALGKGVGAFGKYVVAAKTADVVLDDLGDSADKSGKKVKGANDTFGKTGKGLGGLKGGAGLAAGSLFSLGSGAGMLSGALGLLTNPVTLTIGALAAATAGGVALYKNWDKIQESSTLLKTSIATLAPGLYTIVGSIKGVQSTTNASLPTIENFGKKVSSSTEKAVLGYKKLNDDATAELNELMWSGQIITQEMSDSITGIFGKMGDQISTSLKKDYDKSYGFMSEYFANSKALSESEEATILNNTQARYNRQVETVQMQEAKIKEIMDLASQEKRTLTQEEKNQINQIQQNMMATAVQTMSKSEVEQKVIMERLKNESAIITAQQAADTVANSLKAKDGAVKEANDKYNKTVASIIRERDETGAISAEQANKLIAEAERQKNESIKKATDMHNGVVDQAKAQAKGHVDQVDWTTGQVKSKWELLVEAAARYVNDVSKGINWVLEQLDVDFRIPTWTPKTVSSGRKNPNRTNMGAQAQYAKGTPSTGHPGGLAIVSEKGRELIHEPGVGTYLSGSSGAELRNLRPGTSVLPNTHTERLLKNYGFPGYESGVGSFFDWALKGPKFLYSQVMEKFGAASFPSMGGVFDKIGGGITSTFKKYGEAFLDKKLENLFSFGGGLIPNIKGGASAWRSVILKAAEVMNESVSAAEVNGIIAQIQRESGGNQKIIQSSAVRDINTLNGNPARGLLQYIPQTFRAYAVKGHNNIYSGYDQLLAFFNNTTWRRDLPYGRRGWGPRGGRKYETGGIIDHEQFALLGEGNKEEVVIPLEQHRNNAMSLLGYAGQRLGVFDKFEDYFKETTSLLKSGSQNIISAIQMQSTNSENSLWEQQVMKIRSIIKGSSLDDDSFAMNSLLSYRPGYTQAEDGSWVRPSFYSGASVPMIPSIPSTGQSNGNVSGLTTQFNALFESITGFFNHPLQLTIDLTPEIDGYKLSKQTYKYDMQNIEQENTKNRNYRGEF